MDDRTARSLKLKLQKESREIIVEVNEDMNLKNAIGLAMKNEELAMQNYASLAENCDDEKLKSVFLDLSAMEREHKFKLEKSFVDVAYPEVW